MMIRMIRFVLFSSVCLEQCDQIGQFLMILTTNFLPKVARIFVDLFGLFQKDYF